MRKFKYLFSKKIYNRLLKKRIRLLEDDARNRYIKHSQFYKVLRLLYWMMMVLFLVVMIFLQQKIEAVAGNFFFAILVIFVSFFLPGLILLYLFNKLKNRYPHQSLGYIPRDIIMQCNLNLTRFYKIPENFIVTKCYDSSNQLFIDKDLILFFYKDRLRIVNDFTTTIKDFGCYEFKINEIELVTGQKDNLVTTEFISKKLTLSLGKRAKTFMLKKGFPVNEKITKS